MRTRSFDTMSGQKKRLLKAWWRKLCNENVVLEFDPSIEPYPGMGGGGFRYVPRVMEDENLLIRLNQHTNLTDEGWFIWVWPPDLDKLLD